MLKSIPITEKCLVCYETFKETTDETAIQLICGHAFHYDCILESYKMKTSNKRECPYCRKFGGWLPDVEGEDCSNPCIHRSAYLNKNKKMFCKGYLKGTRKVKMVDGKLVETYQKCLSKSKKYGYCGRHQSQRLNPLVKESTIKLIPPTPTGPPVLMV
tara:strand:+ start:261 stop:734 length:474 start_codon:yes stop_codon:yes gene_type:complete